MSIETKLMDAVVRRLKNSEDSFVILVIVGRSGNEVLVELPTPATPEGRWVDMLAYGELITAGALYEGASGGRPRGSKPTPGSFSWMSEHLGIPEKLYFASTVWTGLGVVPAPTTNPLSRDSLLVLVSDAISSDMGSLYRITRSGYGPAFSRMVPHDVYQCRWLDDFWEGVETGIGVLNGSVQPLDLDTIRRRAGGELLP